MASSVDKDALFADVMGEIFLAMGNYDLSRGLSAYLYPVIRHSAYKFAKQQNKLTSDIDFNLIIDEDPGSADDVLVAINRLIESTPQDELNETARLLLRRILSGHPNAKIANMMGWSYAKTKRNVNRLRQYIAWRMVAEGMSAAPWIDDRDLTTLAAQYQETLGNLL